MKRLNFFLAAAVVALVYGSSRANEEHGMADPLHVPKELALAPAPAVADRCDMEKIKENSVLHNDKMIVLWRSRIPENNLKKPKLIIYPVDATARSWDYLCKTHPESIWNLIDKQGKRAEFNQAASIEDQAKLIEAAAKQWKEVDVKFAAIRAKKEEIEAKAKEYAGSIDKQKKESNLGAAKQKELLAQLITANGEKLLGAAELHAAAGKNWASGGELFNGKEGLYEQLKGLAAHPVIAANTPVGMKGSLEGKKDNEGQSFNRQMMRALWRPAAGEANPDKLSSSVLQTLDPDLGRSLRESFYAARAALNEVNQAVIHQYGPQPGALDRAVLALEGRVSQEKLAALERERKIRDVEQNVARKTAEQIFDRSGRNRGDIKVSEMDAMVNTVRGKMATGEKAITFTAKGKDDKTNTRDMPLPAGEADPKIIDEAKGVADLLMQDKDVQANLAAAGLALKGEVDKEPASDDKENPLEKKGDLSANLETPKDDVDSLRDLAKKSGPGCTKNSMENLKASEEDKIGDTAKTRIKDRTQAMKDLNKSEADADKALKVAEAKADKDYAACKSKLDRRKENRTIRPAEYEKGLSACAGARDGEKSSALGGFNATMSEANKAYKEKVAKAGTEKQISKWEKDNAGKLDGMVQEAYNREITENRGALVSKYGSEPGRVELGRSYAIRKGQLSEDVPEEFVAEYLKARWGNPPAALKDAREYIVKKNAETDAGMDRFVKEADFPKWYDDRKGDISKEWSGDGKKEPAKKEPVKPGEKVKKIDPKAVDEELEKQP